MTNVRLALIILLFLFLVLTGCGGGGGEDDGRSSSGSSDQSSKSFVSEDNAVTQEDEEEEEEAGEEEVNERELVKDGPDKGEKNGKQNGGGQVSGGGGRKASADKPARKPSKKRVEQVAREAAEELAQEPAENISEDRINDVAEELADDLLEDSGEELEDEPAEDFAEEPADGVKEELAEELAKEIMDELVEERVNEEEVYGSSVVGFQAISDANSAQQDVPITFGQVFAQGDVAEGQSVVATVAGNRIPTQVDKKASWPDGSLRHAVISVRLPSLGANTSTTVALTPVADAWQGRAITIGELLAKNFSAEARVEIGGTAYQASARALLQQASQLDECQDWGRTCKRWLSGPLASEWIVGGPLRAGGREEPHLSAYFHVRAYADDSGTVTRVRVDTVIENDWAYAPGPRNKAYDAQIRVGEQRFDVDALTHYRQARWHKVLWWQGEPQVYARLDGEYIQSTGAVSNYADITPTEGFLDSVPSGFAVMDNGDQTLDMGNAGAQPAIGPLPQWTSTYIVSTDARAFAWMLANDDAVGSYAFHYRDRETGRPLEITRHPYVTIAASNFANSTRNEDYQRDLLPTCSSNCGSPYEFDIPHHPSIGYVPYLVTGDFYYLEELQFTASYVALWANPLYRGYEKGRLRGAQGQVRGQAWGLRAFADAAFITPDDDPLNAHFGQLVANNLADYNSEYTDSSDADNPLHVINDRGAVIYSRGGESRVAIAPWQQDFFTWAVGHVARQGFDGAQPLLRWFAEFQIGRMTNWTKRSGGEGYCWLQAAIYSLRIRDVDGGADYSSLDAAYRRNVPDLVGLECNSQEMVNRWSGGQYEIGEMSGFAHSTTGFPSNFQIGLAAAVESGLPDGRLAWDIFANRSVQPDYRDYPNFAVVPGN